MIGTLLNVLTILIGGSLGTVLGHKLPVRLRETVLWGLGLFTIALGLQMTFKSQNGLITLGSVLLGGVLGEGWRIEDRLKTVGAWLEARFARNTDADGTARFIKGFVSASLIFCVGPMAILGAIEDGLKGNYQLLAVKAVMDGFAALAFSASLGVGVLFSALAVLVYQGSISLLAVQAKSLLTEPMIVELTATGGVLIMGIGFGALLELRPIRVANYLPALFIAPVIVAVLHAMGIAGF